MYGVDAKENLTFLDFRDTSAFAAAQLSAAGDGWSGLLQGVSRPQGFKSDRKPGFA